MKDARPLWPYQATDVAALRAALRRHRRVLYTLPTGGGKSTVAVALILARVTASRPVLVLAHRRELIGQMFDRLLDAGLVKELVGVLMADDPRHRPGALVQVASVDTLRRRAERPLADLLVIDEAHRAGADSYQAIAAHYPHAKILGLTATPVRMTGRGLGDVFDHLVLGPSISTLIDLGYLARPRVWTVPADALPDLKGVASQRGDFEPGALSRVVDRPHVIGSIVEHWKRYAEGRQTVVFAVNVAHAKSIARRFKRAGVKVEHLDGETPIRERDGILERIRSGETRVVTNCGVLGEGVDIVPLKCAVLARPTRSLALALQQVGRILRPWRGTTPIILDHAGNMHRHGPPWIEHPWSLADGVRGTGEPLGRVCPECYAVSAAGETVCEGCGFEWPAVVRGRVKEEAGELVELGPTEEEKAAALERFKNFAAESGLGPEWIEKMRATFEGVPHG